MDTLDKLYEHFLQHPTVCTDSRKVSHGSIFFALKGENFDGNRFAVEALQKGASIAVVDDTALPPHPSLLTVEDSLATLQQLASKYRAVLQARFIAITGSNGKTTTKELIYRVLSSSYKTQATEGNLNNHIGVPLTLLSLKQDTEFAIIEMGANHQGEIARLCEIARPGYGLITNIGKAHLEGFGSIEGVLKAKTELYRYVCENTGTLFVNSDNDMLMNNAKGCRQFRYGTGDDTDCKGKMTSQEPFVEVEWLYKGMRHVAESQVYGTYNTENILAAIAVGEYFRIPPVKIKESIKDYQPENNRSQIIFTGKRNRLILDAYNANPTSMEAAIKNFAALRGQDKLLILGDMLEAGRDSESEHQQIIQLINDLGFSNVILTGSIFYSLDLPAGWKKFLDAETLKKWLARKTISGFSILIKGSRKIMLEKVTETL